MLAALLVNLAGGVVPAVARGGDGYIRRRRPPDDAKGWDEEQWRKNKASEHALLKGIEETYRKLTNPEQDLEEALAVFALPYVPPSLEFMSKTARALYEEMLRQDEEDIELLLMSL